MGEWNKITLEQAGVVLIDCLHKTPPDNEDGYPYVAIPQMKEGRVDVKNARKITYEHFLEWTQKAKPKAYDVLLSRRTNPGVTAYVPSGVEFAVGQNLVLLRADGHHVYPPFLRWWVLGPEWWDEIDKFRNVGAIFDSLRCRDVPKFELTLPPLPEQRRIAAVLGALDDKIELNRKMNQTLEGMAQALFKSWFVDFDGHDDLVESEIGPVPRGWEVKPIGDVVEIIGGGTPSTKESLYWENGIHAWVTPKDLSGVNVPVLLEAQRFITDAGLQRISSGLLPRRTFLLSSRAPIGYVAITQIPLAINQGFIAIPPNDVLSSAYLLFWTMFNMEAIKGRAGGTTFAEISKRAFRPIPVLLPPKDVLSEYDAVADLIIERIAVNELESRTLAELRDTLLPKLISGELRVSEAEALVAEVV